MTDKILKFFFIVFCGLISFILFGCKQDGKIKFYRESALNSAINEFQENAFKKDSVSKSRGVVIYKDNSSNQNSNGSASPAFGPRDLDFDLPIKFK